MPRLKLLFIILFWILSRSDGFSQCLTINLIKYPSLENFSCCPNILGMISCADYWTNPLEPGSTSDYFNTCIIDSMVDLTFVFYLQYAYFGNGLAGIICCQNSPIFTPPYREYIQGTLNAPLIKNKCYYSEFWVLPFNHSSMSNNYSAIDAIGMYFSDTIPTLNPPPQPIYVTPQIKNSTGNIISDTINWTKISGTFIASGGEKYITVGTFVHDNVINKLYYNTNSPNVAYYLFDNFSLCPCDDTIPQKVPPPVVFIPNIFSPNGDGSNDVFCVRGPEIDSLHLQIYNRWGNLVFESNDINDGWDGTFKGEKCEEGVYVYWAEITFKNGVKEMKKGDVSLVR